VNHEEKTTEIELPGYKPQETANVVKVHFPTKRLTVKRAIPHRSQRTRTDSASSWDWEVEAPWVFRLIAVLGILLLSLLVL
jgi:hypothetical protein